MSSDADFHPTGIPSEDQMGRVEDNHASKSNLDDPPHPERLTMRSGGTSQTSMSRTTGFIRAPAPAATSESGAVLPRNTRDSMPMDTGHVGDDEANELVDISRNLTLIFHRIEALELKIGTDAGRRERPQVKVTPWRVLNTILIVAVGAYKAAATYLGQTTGPTAADWIIGGVWTLIAYWVTFFEELESDTTLSRSSWVFTHDLSRALLLFLAVLFVPILIFAMTLDCPFAERKGMPRDNLNALPFQQVFQIDFYPWRFCRARR
ncbi:hypothetical protein B0H11DRAFT_1901059 [Mycena galericulata]|nr:hypothetical protein B0H11DRAFT_1901059 [Mycena galericulata]